MVSRECNEEIAEGCPDNVCSKKGAVKPYRQPQKKKEEQRS